jgi:hypothetical protein
MANLTYMLRGYTYSDSKYIHIQAHIYCYCSCVGTVRREPMRIEKTPHGPKFVRRNIIKEIGQKSGSDLSGVVAKKFAQQESSVQETQGSAHASANVCIP